MEMTSRGIFENRWWIVFGSMMCMFVQPGVIILFTFGLFIKPLGAEFGWDRGELSAGTGVFSLITALAVPVFGILTDRFGVRRFLIPTVLLFAASVAALSQIPASLGIFIILMAVTGLFGAGQAPLGYVKSMSGFFDDRRGLALGIAIAGIGFGATLVPQYTQYLIGTFGWRYAFIGLGLLHLVIALPNVVFLIREPTEGIARDAAARIAAGDLTPVEVLPGLDIKETVKSLRFWMLFGAIFLISAVVNGMVVHTVPLLTDHGYSPAAAAGLMAAVGLSTLAGRLLVGFLVDYIFAPYVAALFFLLPCIGMYLISNAIFPVVGIIFLGLASGTEGDMIGYLTTRYFGLKRFGQIYGYMFTALASGPALGAYLMGISFAKLHSYEPALIGFGIAAVVSSALILCLGAYRYPAKPRHSKVDLPRTAEARALTAA
jgi:MFS family permease